MSFAVSDRFLQFITERKPRPVSGSFSRWATPLGPGSSVVILVPPLVLFVVMVAIHARTPTLPSWVFWHGASKNASRLFVSYDTAVPTKTSFKSRNSFFPFFRLNRAPGKCLCRSIQQRSGPAPRLLLLLLHAAGISPGRRRNYFFTRRVVLQVVAIAFSFLDVRVRTRTNTDCRRLIAALF